MSNFSGKVVAVSTRTGSKLIGYIVDPPENNVIPGASKKNGLWLHRRTHLTYLSKDEVKSIRLAKFMEQEIDSK